MSDEPLNEMREIQRLLNQLIGMVGRLPAEMQDAMREQLERTPVVTDYLTGAYNRFFLEEVLRREAARAERYTMSLSLLLVDIDMFKLVNDTFGHVVGDNVLIQIAKTLQQTVNSTDFVFRFGGDEFCPRIAQHRS